MTAPLGVGFGDLGRRIPVVVMGGWLGSGKTTLLNRLLGSVEDERVAVVVNDIGEVNIDAALIRDRSHDTIELTNGCVCCSIGGSLAVTLRDLVLGERPPDRIVIEASGVADPAKVAAYGDRRRVRLDAVIVTIDPLDVIERSRHPTFGPMVCHQAAVADLLVLTKTDLAGPEQRRAAEQWCAEIAPGVPVLDAPVSLRDIGALFDTRAVPPPAGPDLSGLSTATWRPEGPVDLESVLTSLAAPALVRAKGVLTDATGARHVVHRAGRRIESDRLVGWSEVASDALVVIGLDEEGAVAAVMAELRRAEIVVES